MRVAQSDGSACRTGSERMVGWGGLGGVGEGGRLLGSCVCILNLMP